MAKYSFEKSYRLLSKIDFDFLKNRSRTLNSKFFRIYYKESRLEEGRSRLGISVSRKVGKAVVRNRFKRIIRETFRKNIEFKNHGLDVLLVVSPKIFRGNENCTRGDVEGDFLAELDQYLLGLVRGQR